jgi:hypothetical protein
MNDLLLVITTKTTSFDFVLDFLGDKERDLLKTLVSNLNLVDTSKLKESL